MTQAIANAMPVASIANMPHSTPLPVVQASIDLTVGAEPRWAVYRWEPWREPSIVHLTLGTDRHDETDEPLPPRRHIGFVRRSVEADPLLWEGDNA